jgi:hypothetical protein
MSFLDNPDANICQRCGDEYELDFGREPSKYCNDCAQLEVERLMVELAKANERAEDWKRRHAGALDSVNKLLDQFKEIIDSHDEIQQWLRDCQPRQDAANQVVEAARAFIRRSSAVTEEHPVYGLLVMGLPLARAVGAYDAACLDLDEKAKKAKENV